MHGSCFEIRQWSYPVCKSCQVAWFDLGYKLTFESHIKYLKARCQKSLNILKVLSRREWGADKTSLLKLYGSLVRSKLDYCCIVYGSARHTRLTHSFRMENRPHPPLCDQCEGDHELTVKHILIECNFLKIIHRRHYDVTDLNQLFKTVSSKRILDFVRDISLYNSL